jgi:putative ABC transport system permease protein
VTFRDLLTTAGSNLWRMKLRAFLTISGVVIAIAAFVSMLSFGTGMQKNVADKFDELGLFSTMYVYPPREGDNSDSTNAPPLDDNAVKMLSNIPGVKLAYPFDAFSVTATFADTQITADAQALPVEAIQTKMFSRIVAGVSFDSGSAKEAMVTEELLEMLNIEEPDSVIGRELIVSVSVASVDSGLMHIFKHKGEYAWDRLRQIRFDSLLSADYARRTIREELSGAMTRFLDGFMNARLTISDTLVISGVLESTGGHSRIKPIIVPVGTGRRFSSAGFSGKPTELYSALISGTLFTPPGSSSTKTYSRVTLDLEKTYPYGPISDSIESVGYRTFSYAEQFEEIRQFFFYFDMVLGVIGLIALTVASLGIVNTMVMSMIERRREIGVLKSLGANESEIRLMFLVESGVMGSVGAILGIIFGWIITRVASLIAQIMMERKGIDRMELFALPVWLILTAFLFGLVISLAAGYYPSSRAAHVDPVEALRNE